MARVHPMTSQELRADNPFEEMVLNMGPQHPSTHGVLRLLIKVSGEYVEDCQFHVGYLHRCHEKISEEHGYIASVPLPDRLDYVCAVPNGWAMCLAVEKLTGIEVPERAEYLRVIASELNRIASHLLFLSTFAIDLGAMTMLLYGFRERENFLDLLEALSGARLTYHYVRIGGVMRDMPQGFTERTEAFLVDMERKLLEYHQLFTDNKIVRERTEDIGIIAADTALGLGFSGPTLRASGVDFDVRRDDPYGVYDRFDYDIPLGATGDCMDRFRMRYLEIEQSMRIIRQALKSIPDGDIRTPVRGKLKPRVGWAYGHVEGARGDVGYYIVSDGSDKPHRLKIRPPSLNNLAGIERLLVGWKIADVVAILGSIDIVLGDVDR